MMDMSTEGDFMSRKETPAQAALRKAEAGKLATGLAGMTADMTPFVGGAKAATELPDDLSYAKALVEEGYDEGDIKKMGLGGAFTALSILGMVPGVKIATDVGKAAIKGSVKDQMENLITPKRAEQLELAKTLPKEDRRRFLKEINRPTPKVFHGSPEMGKITAVEEDVLQKSYEKLRSNVNLNKERLLSIFVDKDKLEYPSSKDIKKIGHDKAMLNAMGKASRDRISVDELIDGVADNVMLTKPMKLGTQKPGTYIPEEKEIKFKYREEPDRMYEDPPYVGKPYLAVFIDGEETSRRIIIDKDMTVRRNDVIDMFDTLNSNEYNKSSIAKLNVAGMDEARSKAERLEQDGFVPYSEFEGDIGLGMRETRGKHQELGKQMLSTSRDPLVSLKGGFANFDPSNVVSAPLKKSEVRGMSPEMYDDISTYRTDSNIARVPDEPIGLPRSMHLEAEVALSKPEELSGIRQLSKEKMDLSPNVGTSFSEAIREGKLPEFRKAEQEKVAKYRRVIEKDISGQPRVKSVPNIGKMNLEEKVLNGQGMANSLARRENLLHANFGKYGREDVPTKADAKIYYDDVRSYFKDLQSLGQYTEQYGARGTYDTFLKTQAEKTTRKSGFENNIKNIRRAKALPPEKMATLETLYDVIKRIDTISKSAQTSNYSALRGISDKELSDLLYKQKAGDKLLAGDLVNFGLEFKNPDGTTKQRMYLDYSKLGGADLKRLMFLSTQKLNRGGLMSKK
jgi:hypothetical protein